MQIFKIDLGTPSAYLHVTDENKVLLQGKTHIVPRKKASEFVAIGREMGIKITKV